jgi:hypothetical protein
MISWLLSCDTIVSVVSDYDDFSEKGMCYARKTIRYPMSLTISTSAI